MSQENKLDEIKKRLNQIEKIFDKAPNIERTKENNDGKNYGSYQHFQSECMQKIDSENPNSPSRIEVINNSYGAHSTERMAQCSRLWKKYRGLPRPTDGLIEELKFAEKVENGDVNEPER